MGKMRSIFTINGKVGDYVFYTLRGKQVVRKLADPKKKGSKILKPIVGEQNREFGNASKANKWLRQALKEECGKLHDPYLYQRLSKLMLQLKSFDTAPSGQRTVAGGLATEEGRRFFRSFIFHKKNGFFPQITGAKKVGSALQLDVLSAGKSASVTELQIDFGTGKFRRHDHPLCEKEAERHVVLQKHFRCKKGFTDLVFVHGERFLQGCVVEQ